MASPAQLIQTISRVTGTPLPTVMDIDRKLVTAKLRTKGGRGLHVAQMAPIDAARVLTALLASPHANASAEAVGRYAQTRVDKARSSDTLYEAAELDELIALPARHGFVEALEALIASASTGSLARLIADSNGDGIPHIEIYAFTRATRGHIRIAGLSSGLTASAEYHLGHSHVTSGHGAKTGRARLKVAKNDAGDLEQSRRVTERTILSIATLLAGETS